MNILRLASQLFQPSKSALELQRRCQASIKTLGDAALNGRVQIQDSPEMVAWGIALNHATTDTQTGIYGTSASLGVLALSGQVSTVEEAAARAVTSWFPSDAGRYKAKGDFENTMKVAAYVEAVEPGRRLISGSNQFADWIVQSQLSNAGWGYFYEAADRRDPASHIVPSARALLALRRYQSFLGSDGAQSALRWLLNEVSSLRELDASARAVGLYGILMFPDARALVGGTYDDAVQQTCIQLHNCVRTWNGALTLDHHNYPVRRGNNAETSYLDTSREITVALAVLAADYKPARGFVSRCVTEVVQQVESERAVRQGGWLYTSQQLWAARLLAAAAGASLVWLETPEPSIIRQHPVVARIAALIVLLGIAVPLSMLSAHWPDSLSARLIVATLLTVSAICLAGALGVIAQLLRRRW